MGGAKIASSSRRGELEPEHADGKRLKKSSGSLYPQKGHTSRSGRRIQMRCETQNQGGRVSRRVIPGDGASSGARRLCQSPAEKEKFVRRARVISQGIDVRYSDALPTGRQPLGRE